MTNRLLTWITAAAFNLYSFGMAALPQGNVDYSGMKSAEPDLWEKIVNGFTHNTPWHHAIDDYLEQYEEPIKGTIPQRAVIEANYSERGIELKEHKDPIEWPEIGRGIDYPDFSLTIQLGTNQDIYRVQSNAGYRPSTLYMVTTRHNQPERILRVYAQQSSGLPAFPSIGSIGAQGITTEDYEKMRGWEKEMYDEILMWTDSISTYFDLGSLDQVLPDTKIPDYPDHEVPFDMVLVNLPVVADRKKEPAERVIETDKEQKRRDALKKARKRLLDQILDESEVLHAPADSLFAIPELVDAYQANIADSNYRKGMIEPAWKAVRAMWKKRNSFLDHLPEEYTLVGLGSADAEFEQNVKVGAKLKGKHIRRFYAIDDPGALTRAMENFFGMEVIGRSLDLAHDPEALQEVLGTIEGPRVFMTKDTDINWQDPLLMYQGLYEAMREKEMLIRAAPREHKDMLDTYKGIEPAARAYLKQLGLDNRKWRFLGCHYDQKSQEFHNDFEARAMDFLPFEKSYIVMRPGQRFRHLTSRRRDLNPDLERIGFIRRDSITVPGYAIDAYIKEGCR